MRVPGGGGGSFAAVVLATAGSYAAALKLRDEAPTYYWPHARGHVGKYSVTDHMGPKDLNASLAWSWHHPNGRYHTVVVSGPLLDGEGNVYITSEDGARKFAPNGKELWYYKPRGPVTVCPSLMDGALFANTVNGWVFALDMQTGKELWAEKKARSVGGDTAYVETHDGIVVTGVDPGSGGGARRLLGIDAKNGSTLWEYNSDAVLWNVMAVFDAEGSFSVMDVAGGVHHLALRNGTLLWKAGPKKQTFSDGGLIVGPDGTPYTCSNYEGSGQYGQKGALRAYRKQDGGLLWEQVLPYPCNSWPAVTADGSTVVVPAGQFVSSPAAGDVGLMIQHRKFPAQMQAWSLSLGNGEMKAYGKPDRAAAVQAFDARTGEQKWFVELPPYGRLSARGDEEGYLERKGLQHRDQCLPAQFGSPTISADGTVWVGRADGLLYAVDGKKGTYRTYDTGTGFLHPGTSWAPHVMAVASCDGVFVWKY